VDRREHGVGADGALEQLVHARGRRYHQRPRPRYRPGSTGAVGNDDHVDGRGGGGCTGGGGFEEGAGELGRCDGGGVVVVLHAVGVGHALDAVQLHVPQQIERNLDGCPTWGQAQIRLFLSPLPRGGPGSLDEVLRAPRTRSKNSTGAGCEGGEGERSGAEGMMVKGGGNWGEGGMCVGSAVAAGGGGGT